MRQRLILALLGTGMCAGFLLGHHAVAPYQQPSDEAILSAPIARVSLDRTTYGDAIEYVREVSHANIAVDWQMLMDGNIFPQTPLALDLHLHDVTLGQLLDAVAQCSELRGVRLVWTIHDGIIKFSAAGTEVLPAAGERLATLNYDVSDLMTHDGAWERCARSFSNEPPPDGPLTADQRAELLVQILSRGIDADGWRIAGGKLGTAEIHWGRLVITESRENQQAVADVLKILREAR